LFAGKTGTYGSIGGLEHLQLGQSLVLKGLLGDSAGSDEALEGRGSDVPETLVLLLQENNQAGGLGVERAGDVQDSSIDKLLDLSIGDGAVLAQLVDGAAVLGRLDESIDRHGGWVVYSLGRLELRSVRS